jgi:hypothetical protein
MFQRFTVIVNNMRANVVVRTMTMTGLSSSCIPWIVPCGVRRTRQFLESEKYEIPTVDEMFFNLKSSEVECGVRAQIENPTDPHSLALVSGSRTNANTSSRHFSLACLVSMSDEEFDVLGEEDLALMRRWFKSMYMNWKNARRSLVMCYRCGKHKHFIAECPKAMEVMPEHKNYLRSDYKHRSRDDYKGKNKSERRQRK